jgi:hypothetical protein
MNTWPLPAAAAEAHAYALRTMGVVPEELTSTNGWYVARFRISDMSDSEYDLFERPRQLAMKRYIEEYALGIDSFWSVPQNVDSAFPLERRVAWALSQRENRRLELSQFRPVMARVGYYVDEKGRLSKREL